MFLSRLSIYISYYLLRLYSSFFSALLSPCFPGFYPLLSFSKIFRRKKSKKCQQNSIRDSIKWGLVTHETEITLSIPPAQVVEALVEADNLIPKALLPVIKRAEVLEEATSSEGSRYKTVKRKVEAPDEENFIYCCSIVEGDELANTYVKMSHEVKITASPEGGSVCKNTSVYYTDGEVDNMEEKIKAGKEKAFAMVKAIEAYLVAIPDD